MVSANALPMLRDRLVPGGTLAVISYHSGEDRLVKKAFRDWSAACICPRSSRSVRVADARSARRSLGAITASQEEVVNNPRSRSAKLRAWRNAR
jgi:16S rRNA (cytosine1402-N4)-methyltransferase